MECERKCHWNQCSERVDSDGVESEGGEGMCTSYVYELGAMWVQRGGCKFTCRPSLGDVYIHTCVGE